MVLARARRVSRPSPPRRPRGGFSLIEVLIALTLLVFVLLGVSTLFSRSMISNVESRNLTDATAAARDRAEELLDLPFDSAELTVPVGETERIILEVQRIGEEEWIPASELADGETIHLSRRVRVRQYQVSAVNEADLEFDVSEALTGGTSSSLVDVKEIVVWVVTGAWEESEMLGRRKVTVMRVLRTV